MGQPAQSTNLTGFAAEYDNSQNIFYVGQDQKPYQLFWQNGQWASVDIIQQWVNDLHIITLPFPLPGDGSRGDTALASNASESVKIGFLFYISTDHHVMGLPVPPLQGASIPRGGSIAEALNPDLTARLGTPPAMAGSALISFAWEKQQSQHVFFQGNDGNVWELYCPGLQQDPKRGGLFWQANNLSDDTGYTDDLRPKPGGAMAAYMFENLGTEHVVYIARDNTIRELVYTGGKWSGSNLLEMTGAPAPHPGSQIAGYAAEYENTAHVIYVTGNGDVQELYWNADWHNGQPNLTQTTGAPVPAPDSALCGWAVQYEQSQHIIYCDSGSTLWELYHNAGGWGSTNLSVSAGSGAPAPLSSATPLAAYSFENQHTDHVLYLDRNTQVHEMYRSGNAWFAGEKTG